MEAVQQAIAWFVNLGGTYFVPIVMVVIGIVCGAGISKSLKSSLSIGVGLTGLGLITDFSVSAMHPATAALSARLGVDYSIVDIGYGSCTAAWSWPGVPWVMFGILAFNVMCVTLRLTKTLWVDMWNIWHGQAIGVTFWAMTGSLWSGIAVGVGVLGLSMFLGDVHAKRIQQLNKIEGVAIPAPSVTFPATFAYFAMKLIAIMPGLKDVRASASDLKERFGIFGESSVIGALLGATIGLASGLDAAAIVQLTIKLAAVLVILPAMLQFVADGILPLTENLSTFMKRRFHGRELFIAVDPVMSLRDPSVMSTVVIMYPIAILIAAFLPGNNMLPVASLAALPYWVGGIASSTHGNIVYNVILTSLWIIPTALVATQLAVLTTGAATLTGVLGTNIPAKTLVSCWDEGGNLLLWCFVHVAGFIGIGA